MKKKRKIVESKQWNIVTERAHFRWAGKKRRKKRRNFFSSFFFSDEMMATHVRGSQKIIFEG